MQTVRLPVLYLMAWLVFTAVAAGTAFSAAESAPPAKVEPPDQRISRLIEQLGNKDYFLRERAQKELAELGFEAFDALGAATSHDDLEIAAPARYLLRLMRVEWTAKSDPPEVKQALRNYETEDAETRMERMRRLGGLPDGQGVTALCRLARFEKSQVLSKHAAVELTGRKRPQQMPTKQLSDEIRKTLGPSRRTAALWILAWLRFGEDPRAALDEWGRLVESEQAVLRRTPGQSSPRLVAALVRFQIHWLEQLGRKDEALAAMRQLVDLEKGDPEALAELLAWLVDQKAWKVVDEVADRFATRFAANATLLYLLARAQAAQGQKERADETAERAFRLGPGKVPQQLVAHLMAAHRLRPKGLFAWARREYRHVIQNGPPGNNLTATAQFGLSEMLHDQGENLEAAEVLQDLVKYLDKHKVADEEVTGRTAGEIRSRMNYFFAAHWKAKEDAAKYREYLQRASEADAADIDVLIDCHRLPGQPPEYRQKILGLIQKEAARLRQEISTDPENASNYNQFAWLIGNTEGDFDEALRFSKKSIELTAENERGGYYDTLARVYFAKGDYENAVKHQTRAAELDPHSGLVARQLDLFRKTLAEKKKKP